MPLPSPFGDSFAKSEGTEDERPKDERAKKKREVAPISSSAFSFNLGPSTQGAGTSTPKKVDVKSERIDARRQNIPLRYETPLREISTRPSVTPAPGSSKAGRPLQSLPSPFGGLIFKTPNPKAKVEKNGTRLGDMGMFGKIHSSDTKGKRKASEFDMAMKEEARGGGEDSPAPAKSRMKALGQLDKVDLGESVYLDDIQKRVEEEGIGVSPRGKKIIKYSGKG